MAIAAICGAAIGAERERAFKPAGARTHTLIAAAAALIVGIGEAVQTVVGTGDPTRALHAVITGIGFIGAGVIYTRATTQDIGGITTAATILFTATIGVTVGLGAQVVGLGASVLALVVLRLLPMLPWITPRTPEDPGTFGTSNNSGQRLAD